ncbi:MAG: DUF166 family protein [Candidatus Thorarchaeota archaeon]
MKILIISDGKYGDRAKVIIKEKFPSTEFLIIREENPTMFLDEVVLEKEVEKAIKNADLLILYVRHPDVVAEICICQKPTILPIHFGKGFFDQIKAANCRIVQPLSMCNALPNTGIKEIDAFFKKFGSPVYNINIKSTEGNQLIITEVNLITESPCGSSRNTLKFLRNNPLTIEALNAFAMSIRQECREPMSVIFKRDFSETAGPNHLIKLFDAFEEKEPFILKYNKSIKDYIGNIRKGIFK